MFLVHRSYNNELFYYIDSLNVSMKQVCAKQQKLLINLKSARGGELSLSRP